MPVIGYARVSSEEQAQGGVSLDAQSRSIERYCELHELQLARIEVDAGISGATIRKRPGFQCALDDLTSGAMSGLVVTKLDRMARNTMETLEIVDGARLHGWQLHCVHEPIDTTSAAGEAILTVFAAMSQMERKQIGERTRAALDELRRQGRRVSGRPPWGYAFRDGVLVDVPDEQRTVDRLLELRASGAGYKKCARALGVNSRTGRPWTHQAIRQVLKRLESLADAS